MLLADQDAPEPEALDGAHCLPEMELELRLRPSVPRTELCPQPEPHPGLSGSIAGALKHRPRSQAAGSARSSNVTLGR